ncbi:MAG: hypothetical protein OQK04_17530 [Kangiellaceae bacterium]|nr:hypothetical protein [Kangiellaceae bacterium]
MKNIFMIFIALLFVIIGCSNDKPESETVLPEGTRKIEVVETMNGGGYTFIKANENGNELWMAVREMPVEVGDVLYFGGGMVMNNFESKSVNKTFSSILFVDSVSKTPPQANAMGNAGMMPGADGHTKPKVEPATEISVTPLEDGTTIESINNEK